ncbi:MAG: DUF3857 domain-containing protein [Terracidiphilus sp.]
MRNASLFLRGTVLFLAAVSPLVLCAQFQEPTQEELKMTADAKAPGAAAVYLYREETTDDENHFHSYYERIKILADKGKELATIRIPYERGQFKVAKIEGRTIHSDGTVIPLTVKPEDLVDFKTKHFQENTIVFTLPGAEVGSIVEYRMQIHYGDELAVSPRWDIQQPYFVHKAHYSFRPGSHYGAYITNDRGERLDRLMWVVTPRGSPIVVQQAKGSFTVDLTDIPPIPDDDWEPPLNTLNWRVEFYYTYAVSPAQFWTYAGKQWVEDTEWFIKPSGTLTQAAASLVSTNDSDEQKARKIYAAVMKLDNTDYSRVKSEAERKKEKLKEVHTVDDVWKNQAGAGNAIALVYVALARAAGLKVWPMEVVNRGNALFDAGYLNIRQLSDYIAVVVLNGKEVYVDPGRKLCPFGSMYWAHMLAGGLRETGAGAVQALTPASGYKDNTVARNAYLAVDDDRNVTGTVQIVLSGAEALYWRQIALQNDEEEVKKQFIEGLRADLPEGVEADSDHFLALDDFEAYLIVVIKVSGRIGAATGKHFFLPGLFFESNAKHPFVAEDKRTTPIDVHYPRSELDDVTYHLPPGYTVESTPKATDISWPGFALLRINSAAQGDTVEVVRGFGRNFTLLGAEKYTELHDFYSKLAAADQQQIVLARTPATKGN